MISIDEELFSNARVLVTGDFIIDQYVEGVVERISPEAPVPVLRKLHESFRLGGAANVAVNCQALGAKTTLLSLTGFSCYPYDLDTLLQREGLDGKNLIIDPTIKPIIKTRFMADGHHILRVDDEEIVRMTYKTQEILIRRFLDLVDTVDVIVFSDYAKGFFNETILKSFTEIAKKHDKIILVDPKGINYAKYRGCTLIKPNKKEAYRAAVCDTSEPIEKVAEILLEQVDPEYLLITRSAEGMSLFFKNKNVQNYPTHRKEVVDVVGAGDTALALMAVSLAAGIGIEQAVKIANAGSSIVVTKRGCASLSVKELQEALV
ncbi:MAG: hypothetical protein FJZ60_01255 [Chlamydiae bacterium]|nr:hypothetical protein [Chlamydiota bacterium]